MEGQQVWESPAEILEAVGRKYSLTRKELTDGSRTAWKTKARREAAERLTVIGMGVADIGRLFGRHHTTVMYWLGKV